MPTEVIQLAELATAGVVKDTPSVSLAPNVFTDVKNVRFRDSAVAKMKGEIDLDVLDPTPAASHSYGDVQFCAWWPNPNKAPLGGYYVFVLDYKDSGGTVIGQRIFVQDAVTKASKDVTPTSLNNNNGFTEVNSTTETNWQSTLFSGGFTFIINNGIEKPHYIMDNDGNTAVASVPALAELPGWDSYTVNQQLISSTYTSQSIATFDLGQKVDFSTTSIFVTKKRSGLTTELVARLSAVSGESGTVNGTDYVPADLPSSPTQETGDDFNIYTDPATNTTVIHVGDGVAVDDLVNVNLLSRNPVIVRCGVLRSFGNLLVAGNLTERSGSTTVRRLAGVVRTSDLAVPGSVPNNWNPFDAGASTAEEFTLSDTAAVQEMVSLQGNLYIYTNTSIHAMKLTNSPLTPVSFAPVTSQYGAQTTEAVAEFDGKHLIVGSNDIYIFGGHPGSIGSVANGKVRNYFFDNLNPTYESAMFLLRNQAEDEIWICYPTLTSTGKCNEALIYNYKQNNWTIRTLNNVTSGTIAPIVGAGSSDSERPWLTTELNPNKLFPVFAQANTSDSKLIAADVSYQFSGTSYKSYAERQLLSVAPELDTENYVSIAMLTQGSGTLSIKSAGTDTPSVVTDLSTNAKVTSAFAIATDYKSDTRVKGRFFSYSVDDGTSTTTGWNISGINIEFQKGSRR